MLMKSVNARAWGQLPDGRAARQFALFAPEGISALVSDYGCTIISLLVPDRSGMLADVVLGYDSLADYLRGGAYFGCVVGRYANRIAGGTFALDGRKYRLATNNSPGGIPCHLHGGPRGFDKVLWASEPLQSADGIGVRFHHRSPDGSEGFPGELDVVITYVITNRNELRIEYTATCDQPTVLNLTQHSYFNLGGHDAGSILDHELTIAADTFTPVNAGLIPTGSIMPVAHTPFDFSQPTKIGSRINADNLQLQYGLGYDHNFVVRGTPGVLRIAAILREPICGRQLKILTTQPGLQFYSGNFLDGGEVGKGGCKYARRGGLCLETQHFPNSPNQPEFPSVVLRPGMQFRETTVFQFSAN